MFITHWKRTRKKQETRKKMPFFLFMQQPENIKQKGAAEEQNLEKGTIVKTSWSRLRIWRRATPCKPCCLFKQLLHPLVLLCWRLKVFSSSNLFHHLSCWSLRHRSLGQRDAFFIISLSHQVPLGQSLLGLLVIFQIRLQSHQQFLKNRKQGYNVWNSSTLASLRLSSLDSPSQRSSTLARESGSPMLNPMRRTSVPL